MPLKCWNTKWKWWSFIMSYKVSLHLKSFKRPRSHIVGHSSRETVKKASQKVISKERAETRLWPQKRRNGDRQRWGNYKFGALNMIPRSFHVLCQEAISYFNWNHTLYLRGKDCWERKFICLWQRITLCHCGHLALHHQCHSPCEFLTAFKGTTQPFLRLKI